LEQARCVLATAVGVAVLREFRVEARPLSVCVDVWNAAFAEWVNAGYPGGEDGYRTSGAWWLRTAEERQDIDDARRLRPAPRKPWNGHLVVEVPQYQLILDLDAQQLGRPERNMPMPPAAAFAWRGSAGEYTLPGPVYVRYEEWPDNVGWMAAKDWCDPTVRAPFVRALVALIGKGAGR
jgi:hypothetical protein